MTLTRENAKDPQQQLFDRMFMASLANDYSTYTHKPPDGTPYPFVELGYTQLLPRQTKTHILGTVFMQINVWGTINDRRTVSDMTFKMFESARFLDQTDSLKWRMIPSGSDYQILKERTESNDYLFRGLIQIQMEFY